MRTLHPSEAQTVRFGKTMCRMENPGVPGIVAWSAVNVIEFSGRTFHLMDPVEECVAMDIETGEFVRLDL